MEKYNIIRFFRTSGRRKVVARNVTREEAQRHCSRPDTKSKPGAKRQWFDGFEKA